MTTRADARERNPRKHLPTRSVPERRRRSEQMMRAKQLEDRAESSMVDGVPEAAHRGRQGEVGCLRPRRGALEGLRAASATAIVAAAATTAAPRGVVIDVNRRFAGKAAIRTWARNEFIGGRLTIIRRVARPRSPNGLTLLSASHRAARAGSSPTTASSLATQARPRRHPVPRLTRTRTQGRAPKRPALWS
jgi:hypothetical protein